MIQFPWKAKTPLVKGGEDRGVAVPGIRRLEVIKSK
jgi:hypothetical protein